MMFKCNDVYYYILSEPVLHLIIYYKGVQVLHQQSNYLVLATLFSYSVILHIPLFPKILHPTSATLLLQRSHGLSLHRRNEQQNTSEIVNYKFIDNLNKQTGENGQMVKKMDIFCCVYSSKQVDYVLIT